MRHRKLKGRLGRTTGPRDALLSALVCSLIRERRLKTTISKARAARVLAERMVTLGKKATVAARRQAFAVLHHREPVIALFDEIAPMCAKRAGGYTRIIKLGRRSSDSSEMALLEWVDVPVPQPATAPEAAPKT